MAANQNPEITEANYNQFITELTGLTRKYGVAIKSIGGVMVAEQLTDFSNVTYDADLSSGDIYPLNIN
ncbi:MAG: hypothetical protein PXX73_00105 [Sideroxydans sp.]|nr:hypothetical protein [Sideroxydans sp.]